MYSASKMLTYAHHQDERHIYLGSFWMEKWKHISLINLRIWIISLILLKGSFNGVKVMLFKFNVLILFILNIWIFV